MFVEKSALTGAMGQSAGRLVQLLAALGRGLPLGSLGCVSTSLGRLDQRVVAVVG